MAQQSIGIDFGHASLRVVGLGGGKKPAFIGCSEVNVEAKLLQREGMEEHATIAAALRSALAAAAPKPIRMGEVYATISESCIFRKLIEIPVASEEELAETLPSEAAQYLPDATENMEVDFQVLGPSGTDGKLYQVMIVAVGRRTVEDILSVLHIAKLEAKAFEPKPESVGRALLSPRRRDAVLLVDIGQSRATVSAYDHGIVRITSALNVGSLSVLEVDANGNPDPSSLPEKLPRLIGQVADEVEHVAKYYVNRTVHEGNIGEIQLAGAGSITEGIADVLAKAVDVPVAKSQPVISLPPQCDRRFYGALGAALYPWQEVL